MECIRQGSHNCKDCMLSYEPKLYDGGCRLRDLTEEKRKELSALSFFDYMMERYGDGPKREERELASELQRLSNEGYPVKDIATFAELVGLATEIRTGSLTAITETLWVEYCYVTGKPVKLVA